MLLYLIYSNHTSHESIENLLWSQKLKLNLKARVELGFHVITYVMFKSNCNLFFFFFHQSPLKAQSVHAAYVSRIQS